MTKIIRVIDSISECSGMRFVCWLVLIFTIVLGYEIVMRYVFNAPTKWAFDISYMLGGTYFWLGEGYTLYKKKHVRIDIFYRKFCCSTTPPVSTASLGNFIWNDLNQDGIQDGNESGVSNVLAILRRCADDSQVASTNTDASGHYLFTGLQRVVRQN